MEMDFEEIISAFCRLASEKTGDRWYARRNRDGTELCFDFKGYSGRKDEISGAIVMRAPDAETLVDLMFISFAKARGGPRTDGTVGAAGPLVAESGLDFLAGASSKEEFALKIMVSARKI